MFSPWQRPHQLVLWMKEGGGRQRAYIPTRVLKPGLADAFYGSPCRVAFTVQGTHVPQLGAAKAN